MSGLATDVTWGHFIAHRNLGDFRDLVDAIRALDFDRVPFMYRDCYENNKLPHICQPIAAAVATYKDGLMILAVDRRATNAIPVLIEAGADIDVCDIQNVPSLLRAIINTQPSFVRFLVDCGADVNL